MNKTALSVAHVYFYRTGDEDRGLSLSRERMYLVVSEVVGDRHHGHPILAVGCDNPVGEKTLHGCQSLSASSFL